MNTTKRNVWEQKVLYCAIVAQNNDDTTVKLQIASNKVNELEANR